jgi:ATP-binding cassette subfamily B (MDR/TAP) protein 1
VPIILAAGFFRIRYETQFEKINYEVFGESAKFATESIGAIRSVTSLTLESTIYGRYEKLLQDHIKKAFYKAKFSTFVFAMSNGISLLCMTFVLWSVEMRDLNESEGDYSEIRRQASSHLRI